MKQLHERMDDMFSKGTAWNHRTLRTVFDPYSSEWNDTSLAEKVSILRKMIRGGESLDLVSLEYKSFYSNDLNKPEVANDFDKGLMRIVEYLVSKEI